MRNLLIIICFIIFTQFSWAADVPGQFPAGIVYGPKAAYQISAPHGWVLDNYSGRSQGLPCVLYPEGQTWSKSPIIMYAKIASPVYPNKDGFIKFAIESFKKEDEKFAFRIVKQGKTSEGFNYVVNEYDRPTRSHYEQVIYIQLPDAVAYIVYNTSNPKDRLQHANTVGKVLDSFLYKPEYIDHEQ
jgi:hypothetical protein